MKKSFMVIGLGRFGMNVVKTLSNLKQDVIAIDIDEERVKTASTYVDHCLICDPTKKSVLNDLSINTIDHAIVAIGNNLQATILTTMNLKEAGVKKITVRVDDVEYATIIERLGATQTIIPEEASAIQLANGVASDSILDYHVVQNDYAMVKIKVVDKFKEKSLMSLDARNKYAINVVGIVRNNEFMLPRGEDNIKPNDILILVGKNENIHKFEHALSC